MTINLWYKEIEKAFLFLGKKLSEKDKALLLSDAIGKTSNAYWPKIQDITQKIFAERAGVIPASIQSSFKKFYDDVHEVLIRYFFRKVSQQEVLGNINRIKEHFGSTIEENYSIKSGVFLDLANTYWTFRIEIMDLFPENHKKLISQVLLRTEFEIGDIFFPYVGSIIIPIGIRIETQRQILEEYMPEIDIYSFLKNSPVLLEEFQDSINPGRRQKRIKQIKEQQTLKELRKIKWFKDFIARYKK